MPAVILLACFLSQAASSSVIEQEQSITISEATADKDITALNSSAKVLEVSAANAQMLSVSSWRLLGDKFPSVFYLTAANSSLNDESFSIISTKWKLQYLFVEQTKITDVGLAAASKNITSLKAVTLAENKVTDDGVSQLLRANKQLEYVCIDDTTCGINTIKVIKEHLPTLQRLDASRSKVDDESIELLTGMKQLRALFISGTEISDACIPSLAKIKSLKIVVLRKTKVTAEGAKALNAMRPDIGIRTGN